MSGVATGTLVTGTYLGTLLTGDTETYHRRRVLKQIQDTMVRKAAENRLKPSTTRGRISSSTSRKMLRYD